MSVMSKSSVKFVGLHAHSVFRKMVVMRWH